MRHRYRARSKCPVCEDVFQVVGADLEAVRHEIKRQVRNHIRQIHAKPTQFQSFKVADGEEIKSETLVTLGPDGKIRAFHRGDEAPPNA